MDKSAFDHVINIWMLKPNVALKLLFGSKISSPFNLSDANFVTKRLVYPKSKVLPFQEDIKKDQNRFNFTSPGCKYTISLLNCNIEVIVDEITPGAFYQANWLENELKRKLNHWYQQELFSPSLKMIPPSLELIDLDKYQTLYRSLKAKYGAELVQNWTEKTDPKKFVFEDIAIATYIITLWSDEKKEAIRFVDIGCGNGLLVFLLIMEGYSGYGIDIRKRDIWSKYPDHVRESLVEKTITPSSDHLFPDATWLLGNHSDELTPWLPVLAAKSSNQTRVFVLPCCAFDFHGKFAGGRGNGQQSTRYRTYLDFVGQVVGKCGFVAEEDRLRIPSTKRVCFVGRQLTYANLAERDRVLSDLDAFILARSSQSSLQPNLTGSHSNSEGEEDVIEDLQEEVVDAPSRLYHPQFKPRPAEQAIRNGSRVDPAVKDTVCSRVFERLLQEENWVETADASKWNRGGVAKLVDLSQLFSSQILQHLKSEHGGLQTILKNHHQAFHVYGGTVRIRCDVSRFRTDTSEILPPQAKKSRPNRGDTSTNRKTKLCWLYVNHPNGCPYTSAHCNFAHCQDEIVL